MFIYTSIETEGRLFRRVSGMPSLESRKKIMKIHDDIV